MTPRLAWNGYGKAAVRLVKVDRGAARHELHDLTVEVQLQGELRADPYGGRQLGGAAHRHDEEHRVRPGPAGAGGSTRGVRRAAGAPFSRRLPRRAARGRRESRSTDGIGRAWATPRTTTPSCGDPAERRLATVTRGRQGGRSRGGDRGPGPAQDDRLGVRRLSSRPLHHAQGDRRPDSGHRRGGALASTRAARATTAPPGARSARP